MKRVDWWKLGIILASNISQTLFTGFPFSCGVFYVAWCETFFDTSRETIAWIISLNNGLVLGFGPVTSLLLPKIGYRACYILGVLTAASAVFCAAFARGSSFLIISFGIFGGIGNSLAYIPSSLIVNIWFETRRVLANAIATSGVAVGIFVGSVYLEFFLEKYGWQGSLMLYSGAILQALLLSSFMKEPTVSECKTETESLVCQDESTRNESQNPHLRLFRDSKFFLLLVAEVLWNIGSIMFISVVAETAKQAGHASNSASYLITINGISNCAGRALSGLLSFQHRLDNLTLLAIATLLTALPITLVPLLVNSYDCLVAMSVIYGIAFGTQITMLAPVVIEVLSFDLLVHGYGWLMFSDGLGILVGVPLAGFIFDKTSSYRIAFFTGGIASFVSAVLMLAIKLQLHYCGRAEHDLNEETVALSSNSTPDQILETDGTNDGNVSKMTDSVM